MSSVRVTCNRCRRVIDGIEGGGFTGGFYRVDAEPWIRFANHVHESIVCDECMFADPRYIAAYGTSHRRPTMPHADTDVIDLLDEPGVDRAPPVPVLIRSVVLTCYSCNAWLGRLPAWLGEFGDKGDSCHRCGCTSYRIRAGRPFGPRSKDWPAAVAEWQSTYAVLGDDMLLDPYFSEGDIVFATTQETE